MTTEERMCELLVAAGIVSQSKMNQTRKLANSLGDDDPLPRAAEQRVQQSEGGLSGEWVSKVNSLCNIVIDAAGKKYVSSNDLDFANDVLDEVIPLL